MLKKISWTFGEDMKGNNYALGNKVDVFKGQWEGNLFSVQGLGISKAEKFLNSKNNDTLTFYLGKFGVTFHRNNTTVLDKLQAVDITEIKTIL